MTIVAAHHGYLASLPRLPISEINKLPPIRAIYFAVDCGTVAYVGQTENLRQRWTSHHRLVDLSKEAYIVWQQVPSTITSFRLDQIEHEFIRVFNPRLNYAPRQPKAVVIRRLSSDDTRSRWSNLVEEWKSCQELEQEIITIEQAAINGMDAMYRSVRQYHQQLDQVLAQRKSDHERLQEVSQRLRARRKTFIG
jgi:hypothetical protein